MNGYFPLTIDGRAIGFAAQRGVTMSYKAIAGAPAPYRDDNWRLHMPTAGLIPSGMFALEISGGFLAQPPALVVGQVVVVGCSVPLTRAGFVVEADLPRPAVPDSVTYHDAHGRPILDPAAFATAAETRWRPALTCMVTDFSFGGNDVEATSTWSFSLEELEPVA